MGVDSYLPRMTLPGAKVSQRCEWPLTAVLQPAIAESTPRTPSGQPGFAPGTNPLQAIQQELAEATGKPVTAAVAAKAVEPDEGQAEITDQPTTGSEVSHFHLTLFQPVAGMLVLNHAEGLENVHLRLLKNILFALGHRVDMVAPLDNFEWPPSGGAGPLSADRQAASETLNSLLEVYQQKYALDRLLVFGTELAAVIFQSGQDEELFSGVELHGMTVRVMPSFQQMVHDGRFKQQAWQQLKDLAVG